jgi:hypothetical protein
MKNHIILETFYDIHVHCPFCGTPATFTSNGGYEVKGCKHMLFLTADEIVQLKNQSSRREVPLHPKLHLPPRS